MSWDLAVAHLLDFSQDFDTTLLDQLVTIALDGAHSQRSNANEFLVKMKDHPEMWKRADAILEKSSNEATKFFGLQVLSEAIMTRWKVIPSDQREGIRNYVVGKIIGLSSTSEVMKKNQRFLSRLNLVLVNILKQDWPHNWPTFISDIVGSSKTSESLCENNMIILKLLSEEVFDFSRDEMTAEKSRLMKQSLNEEFTKIFQLCEFILGASNKPSLINATLVTLQRFISWIPLGYIFETSLLDTLVLKYFPMPAFRVAAVDCLTEVACLPENEIPESYYPAVQQLLTQFITQLEQVIPRAMDLAESFEAGSDQDQLFIARLALFFGSFLKAHLKLFQVPGTELESVLIESLHYFLMVSEVNDEEIFKTCLEFWHYFTKEQYSMELGLKSPAAGSLAASGMAGFFAMPNPGTTEKKHQALAAYGATHCALRHVLIDRMAKPEEVIIVEDDNGEIIREMTKDTDVIAQYKTMREALVYLTHLDCDDTEIIMLKKLDVQLRPMQFSWTGLNTLCWAIGSISGAMGEIEEKRFLVTVIKDLLKLCEDIRGKDNKAVVASNIMYIVGQYPRFLRAHWKFLKTVVNKLFEFMHEHHPGVQDMACDTFLKISQQCKRKFMTMQAEESREFILQLIGDLSRHIQDLQPHQVQAFYEAVAVMLSDKGPSIHLSREGTMVALMELLNTSWREIITAASANVDTMFALEAMKELSKILRTNVRVCVAAGAVYVKQLEVIFEDMMVIYQLFSEQITTACRTKGEVAVRLTQYKAMRSVKADICELFINFLPFSKDLDPTQGPMIVRQAFLPRLLSTILGDYASSPPSCREAKVLGVCATAVTTMKELLSEDLPGIMASVFEPTLEMITANMTDFPEHRIGFFSFLREANEHCFYGLFSITPAQQKLVVDSIIWAFKHTERNISETGLEILNELLQNVNKDVNVAQPFYQQFLLTIIQEVFEVLTDRLHKSGFRLQASALQSLCTTACQIPAPLYDTAALPQYSGNSQYLQEHLAGILSRAFPNVTQTQVVGFIYGLFDPQKDVIMFKQHLRDFLVTVKEFAQEDNSDLFSEEQDAQREALRQQQEEYLASVPGLVAPGLEDMDPDL
jgi:exportin-1